MVLPIVGTWGGPPVIFLVVVVVYRILTHPSTSAGVSQTGEAQPR
jgi:hypothetical protein